MKPATKVRKMRFAPTDGTRTKSSKQYTTTLRRERHEVAVRRANKETMP